MSLKYWFLLSRIPFLSVVILPYLLGGLLAWRLTGGFNLTVFIFGLLGCLLVQLATHYSGEVYDFKEDRLSAELGKNSFTGGSGVLVDKIIPERKVKALIYIIVLFALFLGVLLQFYFKTGKWTLFLGITGLVCGIFYSKPPLRWVSRGLGEVFIAYAFGWLPVTIGFYIQASRFDWLATLISLPLACVIVNVILINEFPDYSADKQAGKLNILVRIGKIKGSVLYTWLVICAAFTFFLALAKGLPILSIFFYFPVLIIAVSLVFQMLRGDYNDRKKLEKMCALTILVNLGTSLSCILGLLFGR
ncbi:MAG: prenyltransferase [Candidatus Omnitrophica bacterium]|nr:prenyltransferase [Candidatus Omnitrophota bacterium]